MKVKAFGIRLELPSWTSPSEFFTFLEGKSDESVDGDLPPGTDPHRYVRLINDDRMAYGLNVFVRDRKRYYQLQRNRRRPAAITAVDFRNMLEFNFFYLWHDTGCGIMTHYRGCETSVEMLGVLINRRFREFKEDVNRRNRSRVRGNARLTRLPIADQWDEIAEKCRGALSARISYDVPEIIEQDYRPQQLRYAAIEFDFQEGTSPSGVVSWLKELMSRFRPKRASLRVVDADREEMTIQVGPTNYEVLNRWDFEDVADNIDLNDWRENALMQAILADRNHRRLRMRVPRS